MCSVLRLFVLAAIFIVTAVCVSGQDLGSSNKLFGGGKTTASKPAKKPAPKPRPAAKKPSSSSKNSKSSGRTSATAKPKETAKPSAKKVDIAPAKNSTAKNAGTDVPVSEAGSQLFEKLINEGNIARDDRNYMAAETAYQRARAIKPKDARAVYGLGNLYSDQQRWEESETAYRTALQLEPKDAVARIALSYVLTQPLSAENLSERYQEAETLAREAIKLAPTNPLAFDQLGVSLELRGLVSAETENAYRRAIQLDPTFAPAYAHLGRLLRRRGLTKESATAYQDAISRSNDVATMILVAEVMQSEQRYAESEKLLRSAIGADPRNPAALLLLGRALITLGNYADAEMMLRRGLVVSPSGFTANSLLGDLYSRQGNYEMAESSLLSALRSVPVSEKRRLSQQFEAVGDGYLKGAKRINAERAYRQALALDADNAGVAAKIARAHG